MSNLQNATEVFLLGKQLGLDIGALYEVVSNSSGSSAVLESIRREITMAIAPHLQQLMRKDIEHFADAIRSRRLDAAGLRQRGIIGANGLVSLFESITIAGAAGR